MRVGGVKHAVNNQSRRVAKVIVTHSVSTGYSGPNPVASVNARLHTGTNLVVRDGHSNEAAR